VQLTAEVARLTADYAAVATRLAEREHDHTRWVSLDADYQALNRRYTAVLDRMEQLQGACLGRLLVCCCGCREEGVG
jgi:hypothetical protein